MSSPTWTDKIKYNTWYCEGHTASQSPEYTTNLRNHCECAESGILREPRNQYPPEPLNITRSSIATAKTPSCVRKHTEFMQKHSIAGVVAIGMGSPQCGEYNLYPDTTSGEHVVQGQGSSLCLKQMYSSSDPHRDNVT